MMKMKMMLMKNDVDNNDNDFDDDNNDNNYDDDINDDIDQQSSSVRHREANRSVLVGAAHSDVSETKTGIFSKNCYKSHFFLADYVDLRR